MSIFLSKKQIDILCNDWKYSYLNYDKMIDMYNKTNQFVLVSAPTRNHESLFTGILTIEEYNQVKKFVNDYPEEEISGFSSLGKNNNHLIARFRHIDFSSDEDEIEQHILNLDEENSDEPFSTDYWFFSDAIDRINRKVHAKIMDTFI